MRITVERKCTIPKRSVIVENCDMSTTSTAISTPYSAQMRASISRRFPGSVSVEKDVSNSCISAFIACPVHRDSLVGCRQYIATLLMTAPLSDNSTNQWAQTLSDPHEINQ